MQPQSSSSKQILSASSRKEERLRVSVESSTGAWMPLSVANQVNLLSSVGLFDTKYNVPHNPWCAHEGQGCGRVYNQSYHSVYHTDSHLASHFREWLVDACRYQPPKRSTKHGSCTYPWITAEASGLSLSIASRDKRC